MQQLLPLFPFILKSKNDFEHQNKLLNKVTLTGKINSDSRTTNLFEFADNTSKNFSELKDNLINILLKENLNTLTNELQSKASVTIDILIRNLFERTADVGFLATDTLLIEFLKYNTISKDEIKNHLQAYVSKYSVYNEVVIFDIDGNVKANLNDTNIIDTTTDSIIKETLNSSSYVERYAYTDIFKSQTKTLTFTQKIVDKNNRHLGILCLCFKFEDEMERIINNIQSDNEIILLLHNNKIVLSTDTKQYPLNQHFKDIKSSYSVIHSSIAVSAKTSGYQEYYGLNWLTVVLKNTKQMRVENKQKSIQTTFINENIMEIIEQADNIVDDLSDIIINGELIAAKRQMYLLNPILDNLRVISTNLLSTIKNAGENLESLSKESLKFNLISSSKLAIDIMDRNLYERANDSRWWALTPLFIKELSSNRPDMKKLNARLSYINTLYTVYTNILIYNKSGQIIASSKDVNIVGEYIKNSAVSSTLNNKDTQKYFVSKFENTELYNNEATYIYHASIHNHKETLGGIALVFDSTVEFKAILNDSFTHNVKGFSLFIDENSMILSSTNDSYKVNTAFPLEKSTLENILKNDIFYDLVTINEKSYIIASALSKGYREYKIDDNYKNSVISLTLITLQ